MATFVSSPSTIFALGALVLLSACGGGGGAGSPATEQPTATSSTTTATASATVSPASVATVRTVPKSDLEIAQALYSDSNRTPTDFYSEGPPPTTGYIATTHLKSSDITSSNIPLFELCTDDFNQALAWSEQAARNAPQYADLMGNNSNARFFEFQRARSSQPNALQRTRIYKCNYLDRGSVNLRVTSSIAGQLNRKPATASDLKELSEYLWQFTLFNNYGNAVLQSSGAISATGLQHNLVIASIGTASSNGCDRIDIKNWTHTLDSQSGELTLTTTTVRSFNAKRVGGYAESCAP